MNTRRRPIRTHPADDIALRAMRPPRLAVRTVQGRPSAATRRRRGSLLPAVAMALLVVGAAAALVLDRLWIDAAQRELSAAAEAAALASASRLADDDQLRADFDPLVRAQAARDVAGEIARQNRVAGMPVALDTRPGGDVRLGRVVREPETGRDMFLETEHQPTSVVVTAQRLRSRGNALALFFRTLSGEPASDVQARVEASVDNRIIGVREIDGAAVPALSLAILAADPLNQRTDTWARQIEARQGTDAYAFDAATGQVVAEADGIPEILLHAALPGEPPHTANLLIVDIGNGLDEVRIGAQWRHGWAAGDLTNFGGEFRTDQGPQTLDALALLSGEPLQALEGLIGQPRICLLYDAVICSGSGGIGQAEVTRLVAGRIMDVGRDKAGHPTVVVQPCVLTTRAALLAEPGAPWSSDPGLAVNPYLYKLHVTQ